MFGIIDLPLFVVAGLLLNMTPGADTLYIVGRAAGQGRKAGVIAALGIGAGCFVHIFAATIGLSALLSSSAMAFTTLKWIGAAYIVYLGISMLISSRHQKDSAQLVTTTTDDLLKVFAQGFLTNVLNPKVALFFLAFLPQFIQADVPSKWMSMIFLGIVFNVNGTLWNILVALGTARLSKSVKRSGRLTAYAKRIAGSLFLYLGYKLAVSKD